MTGAAPPRTRAEGTAAGAHGAAYWDEVVGGWPERRDSPLWRQHSDRVNGALLDRWLPQGAIGRALKTDLFDEAVGDGLYPVLRRRARSVIGIDLSPEAVARAQERHPGLDGVVADVRQLPFPDESFDLVVSTSTLDHFASHTDLDRSVAEVHRVLRPGGELLITMDNTHNPVIAVRRRIQEPLLKLGILPYYTGVSCNAAGLRALLDGAGFEVRDQTTLLHSPRVLALATSRALDACRLRRLGRPYLGALGWFERLSATRAARVTGYFVAARAVKR